MLQIHLHFGFIFYLLRVSSSFLYFIYNSSNLYASENCSTYIRMKVFIALRLEDKSVEAVDAGFMGKMTTCCLLRSLRVGMLDRS